MYRCDGQLVVHLIASAVLCHFFVQSLADPVGDIVDVVVVHGTDVNRKFYLLCHDVHSAGNGVDVTYRRNGSVRFLPCPVGNLGDYFCSCVYRVHSHIHRCGSRMVRSSVNGYHVSLDSNDTFYQAKFCAFCIQNRSLLDVCFQELSDGAFLPCSLADLFRIQAVALHGVINGHAVGISKFFGVLYVSVSQHCSGSEISGSETHTFLITEANHNKVSLRNKSFFF